MRILPRLPFVLTFALLSCLTQAQVKVSGFFTDNMILQRGDGAAVWGTASPGEEINLTLGENKITATADEKGEWRAVFKNLAAAEGLTLTIAGKDGSVSFKNVAIGEVWFCSGQSNMGYRPIEAEDVPKADNPKIRYFDLPLKASLVQERDPAGGNWMVSTPENVTKFSAVAYYFARDLQVATGVPVGIIYCARGGSLIRPWIALDALHTVPGLKEAADAQIQEWLSMPQDAASFPTRYKAWQEKNDRTDPENKGLAAGWANPDFDDSGWITTKSPGDWSSINGMPNGGVVWLRKKFTVPPEAAGKDIRLHLGPVADLDIVYFNGEEVAHGNMTPPYYFNAYQDVTIPGRLVHAGENLLALRVLSQIQKPRRFGFVKTNGIPVVDPANLTNDYQAKVEVEFPPLSAAAMEAMPKPPIIKLDEAPGTLFNGIIEPVSQYLVKGAVWYQGESNENTGWAYRTELPLMIKSWRAAWKVELPIYIVQLPQLGDRPRNAGEGFSGWVEVRDAQFHAFRTVPNTHLAVIIDAGDAHNLHPPHKAEVGGRLARMAMGSEYGGKGESSGPVYESMKVEGNKIRLQFSHVGGGLVAKGGEPLKQFAITGSDHKWTWGDAVIDGDTIVVSSPAVSNPVAVRYAWAANPEGCNLANQDGLMASPFRTDDWPLPSEGKWR